VYICITCCCIYIVYCTGAAAAADYIQGCDISYVYYYTVYYIYNWSYNHAKEQIYLMKSADIVICMLDTVYAYSEFVNSSSLNQWLTCWKLKCYQKLQPKLIMYIHGCPKKKALYIMDNLN